MRHQKNKCYTKSECIQNKKNKIEKNWSKISKCSLLDLSYQSPTTAATATTTRRARMGGIAVNTLIAETAAWYLVLVGRASGAVLLCTTIISWNAIIISTILNVAIIAETSRSTRLLLHLRIVATGTLATNRILWISECRIWTSGRTSRSTFLEMFISTTT